MPDEQKSDKEHDAVKGYGSPARHRPGEPTTVAGEAADERRPTDEPGPPGDLNTRGEVAHEDKDVEHVGTDGSTEMTAAEQSGQVAYGGEDTSGDTGATGAESSSG